MSRKNNMPWVAVLGADGSGKSTVIDGLIAHLASQKIDVVYQHWRPVLGGKDESDNGPVVDPHAQTPRGIVASMLKVAVLLAIWRLSFWGDLGKQRREGKLILFDRFYADLLNDPIRYRYGGSRIFASILFKCMPKPDLVILLDAEAEVLYARKPEVEMGELKKIVSRYRQYIKNEKRGLLINADQDVHQVIADAIKAVEQVLHTRLL
jgi:thymidylate kinase